MQDWIAFKGLLIAATGLDRDALHIAGSTFILIAAGLLIRKPLSSGWPWSTVLIFEATNEAVTGFADGAFQTDELAWAARDAFLVMTMPTLLLFLCRFVPRLLVPKRETTHIMVPAYPWPDREAIIDAEFEEVQQRY